MRIMVSPEKHRQRKEPWWKNKSRSRMGGIY